MEEKMGTGRTLQSAKQAKPNYVSHGYKLFLVRLIVFHGIKMQ